MTVTNTPAMTALTYTIGRARYGWQALTACDANGVITVTKSNRGDHKGVWAQAKALNAQGYTMVCLDIVQHITAHVVAADPTPVSPEPAPAVEAETLVQAILDQHATAAPAPVVVSVPAVLDLLGFAVEPVKGMIEAVEGDDDDANLKSLVSAEMLVARIGSEQRHGTRTLAELLVMVNCVRDTLTDLIEIAMDFEDGDDMAAIIEAEQCLNRIDAVLDAAGLLEGVTSTQE